MLKSLFTSTECWPSSESSCWVFSLCKSFYSFSSFSLILISRIFYKVNVWLMLAIFSASSCSGRKHLGYVKADFFLGYRFLVKFKVFIPLEKLYMKACLEIILLKILVVYLNFFTLTSLLSLFWPEDATKLISFSIVWGSILIY